MSQMIKCDFDEIYIDQYDHKYNIEPNYMDIKNQLNKESKTFDECCATGSLVASAFKDNIKIPDKWILIKRNVAKTFYEFIYDDLYISLQKIEGIPVINIRQFLNVPFDDTLNNSYFIYIKYKTTNGYIERYLTNKYYCTIYFVSYKENNILTRILHEFNNMTFNVECRIYTSKIAYGSSLASNGSHILPS
jgi:hypothetical protein